jgi:hypothetical protein
MHTIPYTGLATLLLPYFCFLVTGAINLCRKGNRDIEPLKETDYEQFVREYLESKGLDPFDGVPFRIRPERGDGSQQPGVYKRLQPLAHLDRYAGKRGMPRGAKKGKRNTKAGIVK